MSANQHADETSVREDEHADGQPATRATVLSYQWTPGARFEVVEADVDRQPARVRRGDENEGRSRTQTHVIRYDFSPSYRAFLFTDDETTVHRGGRYRFDDSSARAAAGPTLIDVDVTPLE